jgi:hypothetical protein
MFTKESFSVISVTEIPKQSLLKGVIKLLEGREMYIDADDSIQEKVYSGDVFEAIASELAEMGGSPFFPPFEVVEQIDNLAEIITTELVRINEI